MILTAASLSRRVVIVVCFYVCCLLFPRTANVQRFRFEGKVMTLSTFANSPPASIMPPYPAPPGIKRSLVVYGCPFLPSRPNRQVQV